MRTGTGDLRSWDATAGTYEDGGKWFVEVDGMEIAGPFDTEAEADAKCDEINGIIVKG